MQSNVKHTNLGSSFVTPWNVRSWSRCEQTNPSSPEVKNLVPTRGKILIRFPTGKPLQLNTRLRVDTGLARSTGRKSVLSRYSQRCLSLRKPPWECKYSVIDGCTQFNRTNAFSRRVAQQESPKILLYRNKSVIMIFSGIYSAGARTRRNSSAVPPLWPGQERQAEEAEGAWKPVGQDTGHRGVVPAHTNSRHCSGTSL